MAPLQPHAGHVGLVLPLCTTAATVGLSLYQYPVFMSFLQEGQTIAGRPLSKFWEPLVKSGRALKAGLALSSTIGGGLAARWLKTHLTLETGNVSQWYIAGSVLAAGHLAFLPLLAGPVQRIINSSSKDEATADRENREEMKTWLMMHTVRLVCVDLPALWCFAEGVAMSFWVTP